MFCLWFLMLWNLCLLVSSGGATMPDVIGIYFNFNSGDLASTSSQMCGSWNLPMFLLRDGSLALMKIASLMFLPAHNAKLVQGYLMTCDILLVYDGDGAVMCSLNLSPKVLPEYPMYSSSQSTLSHLYL